MSRAQLEKRYGISIVENGFYRWDGKYVRLYDMYSADGACWDKGLKTIRAVEDECKEWKTELLSIKTAFEEYVRKNFKKDVDK